MARIILPLAIILFGVGGVVSQEPKGSPSGLNGPTLRAQIKFLSDDLLEGRGTGARGGELAAKYLAAQFEAMGLKGPAEGGGYLQPVSLAGVKADPNTALTVTGSKGSESFKFAD